MRSYGQFCPIAKAAELFCNRWTALIIRDLAAGAMRFTQLKRGVPLASPTLLSRRLKELEQEGVVERRRPASGRGWSYHLTRAGEEFRPLVEALGVWGQRWSRRALAKYEVNLTLLLWALEISVKPAEFKGRRCTIKLTFTDQPEQRQNWWFVNESGRVEPCFEDPGFDVDLYLITTLPDLILVHRGDARRLGVSITVAVARPERVRARQVPADERASCVAAEMASAATMGSPYGTFFAGHREP
ncbi:MAG: winged helix-turn-helix transcriptional regulator [Steroidobacteraceae bacterium]